MQKIFRLQDLDCAHCAAKMEAAINKMPQVHHASINFMTQKLTVDIDEENFDSTMKAIQKAIKKVDCDCTIVM